MNTHTVTDSFGSVEVPDGKYWGAQTARALAHFDIGDSRFPCVFIRAYGLVKLAACQVNARAGHLPEPLVGPIASACEEVIAGSLDDHFPLVIWQTGSGTQTNMNLNEVIANRANELLGIATGSPGAVHPNDHVNRSQSTNDSFPTAMHVASALEVHERLLPQLRALQAVFTHQAERWRDVIKLGRTHLQDATPISLGQEVSGWAAQLALATGQVEHALGQVYQLAQGGTAVGTGLNSDAGFDAAVARVIAARTGLPFVPAGNKFQALAGHEALLGLSGALKTVAAAMMKIANDVRWLASGPRGGLGELTIPDNEPGSSIMPGKVNPTQCEAVTMVACRVFGNDVTVGIAGSQGNFELNVFKPVIVHAVLESVRLLGDVMHSFRVHCADGIAPNGARIAAHLASSLMLATALNPHIGYDRASQAVKKAVADQLPLRDAVAALGFMTAERFDEVVQPRSMIAPSQPGPPRAPVSGDAG